MAVDRGALAHLSLCGESPSESKESPYCRGCRWGSVKPQCAARLARASMHAGLLHLLVPTEDDIMPEGQSERTLSVRSRLHVLPSCLRKRKKEREEGRTEKVHSEGLKPVWRRSFCNINAVLFLVTNLDFLFDVKRDKWNCFTNFRTFSLALVKCINLFNDYSTLLFNIIKCRHLAKILDNSNDWWSDYGGA